MTMLINIIIGLFVLADISLADLNTQGAKCGAEKYCNNLEYCSTYDNHCRSCEVACDVNNHNSEPEECAQKCQGKRSIYFLCNIRYSNAANSVRTNALTLRVSHKSTKQVW